MAAVGYQDGQHLDNALLCSEQSEITKVEANGHPNGNGAAS